ncbi:MAG: hypothetical protein GQ570_02290 [Helicobacteraceae bacterium]|nr:hypothetical protein [Helicobacteraceae bacterium]
MQTINIQRLKLFDKFFHKEIIHNNEYLSYILVGNINATPKPQIKETKQPIITLNANVYKLRQPEIDTNTACCIFTLRPEFVFGYLNFIICEDSVKAVEMQIEDDCFHITKTQPHNNMLSLV